MSDIAMMIAIAKKFGGSSAPAPVVILPETELTPADAIDDLYMYVWGEPSPFENLPVAGNTYKINWGGVDYISKAVDVSSQSEAPAGTILALGNTDLFGGMGVENPAPGAPYFLGLMPTGFNGMHVQMMTNGITPEPPVLSIVQTEGASADSGSGGGTEVYTVTATGSTSGGLQVSDVSKSFEEILTAAKAGYIVRLVLAVNGGYIILPLTVYTDTTVVFFGYPTAGMSYQVMGTADGFTGDLGT